MEVNLNKIFEDYTKITDVDNYFYMWSIKQQEAQALFDSVQQLNASKIIVIGAFKGVSTKVILQAIGDRQFDFIANIDPFFSRYVAGDDYYSVYKKAMEGITNGKIITIEAYASSPGAEIYTCTSGQLKDIPSYGINQVEGQVDLCFLDGDHHYPTCLEDFKIVWEKIRVGGVVLIHDISNSWKPHIDLLMAHINGREDVKVEQYPGIDGMAKVYKIK
jgi:hypothetical protein